MCQGCVEEGGLSQATYDKIEAFAAKWPDAEFGPAHIVIGDDNVDDYNIGFCRGIISALLDPGMFAGYDRRELEATKAFLDELMAIEEDDR